MVKQVTQFHKRLHQWYSAYGREDLPWRNTRDPYAIYLSEIMLQQTQVKTVLERFYYPFLKKFPTLSSLAAASEKEVLTAWQGLGYYSRALNLHKAAKTAGKSLPHTVEELLALPGIGRNTAHAVAAFAYHRPVAVVEANVKRVISRIFALKIPSDQELWDKATQLLDKKNPFDYNQAMMDIGAMICTKTKPKCPECPANIICEGKAAPELYPAKKPKKAVPVRHKNIAVFRNERGHYYAIPRESRFLGGLYHFVESDALNTEVLFFNKKYRFQDYTKLGHIEQQYSHFTLNADIWLIPCDVSDKDWHSPTGLKKLPVSIAERKIMALLDK